MATKIKPITFVQKEIFSLNTQGYNQPVEKVCVQVKLNIDQSDDQGEGGSYRKPRFILYGVSTDTNSAGEIELTPTGGYNLNVASDGNKNKFIATIVPISYPADIVGQICAIRAEIVVNDDRGTPGNETAIVDDCYADIQLGSPRAIKIGINETQG